MLLLIPETHFPAFLGKKKRQSVLSLCSQLGQRFLSPGARCWPGHVAVTSLVLGWIHPASPPCPSPCATPSLADWELKISETQGITGCLNISLL